jgi:hypothetical protein
LHETATDQTWWKLIIAADERMALSIKAQHPFHDWAFFAGRWKGIARQGRSTGSVKVPREPLLGMHTSMLLGRVF